MNTSAPLFLIVIFILAGNKDMHKSFDVFEFWPDLTNDYEVSCP